MQDFSNEYNVSDLVTIVPRGTNFEMKITPRFLSHYTHQSYENFTSLLIKNFAKKSDYFLDVGAHYGYFSLLANEANKNIKIKAIEPIKENYHILSTNLLPITSKENIINLAISDKKCQKEFHKSLASDNCGFLEHPNAATVEKFMVEVENLDNLFLDKISDSILVKVDTEGNELDVLKGMSMLLEKIYDIKFILEINPKMLTLAQSSPEVIFSFLSDNDFSIYGINDKNMHLVKLNHSNWKNHFYGQSYFNVLAIRKHIELNICFFSHSSALGGAERSLLDLIRSLVSQGVICSIVMPGEGPLKVACQSLGVTVKIVPSMSWWCNIDSSESCFQEVANSLKTEFSDILSFVQSISPDAIYSQTIVNPFGAMIAEELNLPHFWAIREYGELDHSLKFWFDYKSSMKAMFDSSDYIFGIAKTVATVVLDKEHTSDKVQINYSKVDVPEKYKVKEFKPNLQETTKIGVFGAIVEGKNQRDAINAVLSLLNQGYDVELYLVGTWQQDYYDSLMEIIQNSSFGDKVKFTGYVDDPIEVMNDMHIVISCAKLEALGRTLFEAILLKVPIIYSNTGGPAEIYKNEVHGLAYQLNNDKDLADKIIETIQNSEKTKQRIDEAYQYVLNNFTENRYVNPIIEALKIVKNNLPKRINKNVTQHVMSHLPLKSFFESKKIFIQLFIDQGNGISEENSIKLSVAQNSQTQEFTFDLTDKPNIKDLRIDPLNECCVIEIESLHVKKDGKEIELLQHVHSNAEIHHGTSYFFTTDDSQMYFSELAESTFENAQVLVVVLRYAHIAKDALHVSVKQKNQELEHKELNIQSLNQELEHKELNIQSLNHQLIDLDISKSWKIISPLRKIMRIIRKSFKGVKMFKNEYEILKKSNLFDEKYYLVTYPDVQKANIDPIKHYIEYGWKEKRNPSAGFDTNFYLETYSDVRNAEINPLAHYIKYGKKEKRKMNGREIVARNTQSIFKIDKLIALGIYANNNPHLVKKFIHEVKKNGFKHAINLAKAKVFKVNTETLLPKISKNIDLAISENINQIFQSRFQATAPLRVYIIPTDSISRISIVTDSINNGSLYGGVGTAIIMASLLAEAKNARLRFITRTEKPDTTNIQRIFEIYGITLSYEVEFVFAPFYDNEYEIDIFREEIFITTSWWTTASTMASVSHKSIIYLLQEDERMFYPYGDDHLSCSKVLGNPDIRFIINTQLLFTHFANNGLNNIVKNGVWFEPAFPKTVFFPRKQEDQCKYKLMFYARPNNLRNLFYFGIKLLEEAIIRGIIDLNNWDIIMVGKDIPRIEFSNNYVPEKYENLTWNKYSELVGNVDLGLCLMYTPHPSYPPLDLAASGAVVVTNRFGNKQDLSNYSKNILCGNLDLESMLVTLATGLSLAQCRQERVENFYSNNLESDWKVALSNIIVDLKKVQ